MKKFWKISLVSLAIIVGVGAVNYFYTSRPASPAETDQGDLSKIMSLEISPDSGKEQFQDKYYERFIQVRETLEASLDNAGKVSKNSVSPLIEIGNIQRSIGDLRKAEQAFLLVIGLDPKNYLANGNLGDLYFRYFNEYEKSVPYFLTAIEVDSPMLDSYYSELFELYHFHLNDTARAEEILIQGIEKYPSHIDLLVTLALLYEQRGDSVKAIETYKKLLQKVPDSALARDRIEALRS